MRLATGGVSGGNVGWRLMGGGAGAGLGDGRKGGGEGRGRMGGGRPGSYGRGASGIVRARSVRDRTGAKRHADPGLE